MSAPIVSVVVETINGERMATLRDVSAAFAKPADFYVVEFLGAGYRVLHRGLVAY